MFLGIFERRFHYLMDSESVINEVNARILFSIKRRVFMLKPKITVSLIMAGGLTLLALSAYAKSVFLMTLVR